MFHNQPDRETQQRVALSNSNFELARARERKVVSEMRRLGITKTYANAGPSGQPHLGQGVGSFDDLFLSDRLARGYSYRGSEQRISASIAVAPMPATPLTQQETEGALTQGREKLRTIDERLSRFQEAQRQLFPESSSHQPFHKLVTLADEPVLITEGMPWNTWDLQWKKGEIGSLEIPDLAKQHLEVVRVAHKLGLTFKSSHLMNPLYTHTLNAHLLPDGRYSLIPNPDYLVESTDPIEFSGDRATILQLVLDIDSEIRTRGGRQRLFDKDKSKIELVLKYANRFTTDDGLLEIFRNFEFMRESDIRRLLAA